MTDTAPRLRSWILLITLLTSLYGVGSVWVAQLDWSLWRYVGPADFDAYHVAWWHGIWWAIFPAAGVALAGSLLQLRWPPLGTGRGAIWLVVALQVVAYLLTAFWWGPGQAGLHTAQLPGGGLDPHYAILLNTNWLRVALFTAVGLVELWVAARAIMTASDKLSAAYEPRSVHA